MSAEDYRKERPGGYAEGLLRREQRKVLAMPEFLEHSLFNNVFYVLHRSTCDKFDETPELNYQDHRYFGFTNYKPSPASDNIVYVPLQGSIEVYIMSDEQNNAIPKLVSVERHNGVYPP